MEGEAGGSFSFLGSVNWNYTWWGTACNARMQREIHFVDESVVEVVIFSGISENFQKKDILQPSYKVLFLSEPFPLQRMKRMQPLKSQIIRLGPI